MSRKPFAHLWKWMTITLLLNFNYFTAQCQVTGPKLLDKKELSIGETLTIESKILEEQRKINVYLPYGYAPDSTRQYDVIYLLDGSIDEDFIHIVGLVQFGNFPWARMLPESIVVGIANVDRKRDFTYPSQNEIDNKELPTSGRSSLFIEFISEELVPMIKSEYQVSDSNTLIGQSLGGLLASEILFKHPTLFKNYMIISPSLWWDDESLLSWDLPKLGPYQSVYIAVGKEGETMERVAHSLHQKLDTIEAISDHLYFNYLEDQDHTNLLHPAVYEGFRHVFGKSIQD